MGTSGGEPRILLNALKPMLSMNGDIKTPQEVMRIVGLMKDAEKLMSRCIYLNILRATCLAAKESDSKRETLQKFLIAGGWGVLNKWLMEFSKNENFAILLELIEVLKNMPITVELLKQGNTGKLIKQMTKLENAELKRSAMLLIKQWKDMIRGGSGEPPEKSNKPTLANGEHLDDSEKRSGEMETEASHSPSGKRMRENHAPGDSKAQPPEKKVKTGSGKPQPKVKIIEPLPKAVESSGFMNALAVAATTPVVKKKKKPAPPVAKPNLPLDEIFSRQNLEKVADKESAAKKSPAAASSSPMRDTGEQEVSNKNTTKEEEKEEEKAKDEEASSAKLYSSRTGKKKKSVRWASDDRICETFFFEIGDEERAAMHQNVNFSAAKQMELLRERKALATAKRLSEDRMVERVPWKKPLLLDCAPYPIKIGEKSTERLVQSKREQNVLADIFLTKASLRESPAEPDLELEDHNKKEPTMIPHDEAGTLYPTPTSHHATPVVTVPGAPVVPALLETAQTSNGSIPLKPDAGFGPIGFNKPLGVGLDHIEQANNADKPNFPIAPGLGLVPGPRFSGPNNIPSTVPGIPNQGPNFKKDVTSTVQNILTQLRGNNVSGNPQEAPGLLPQPELPGNGQGLLGPPPGANLPDETFGTQAMQPLLGIGMNADHGIGRGGLLGNRGRGAWAGGRGGPRGQAHFHGNREEEFEEVYDEEYDESADYSFHGGRGRGGFNFKQRGHGMDRGRGGGERGRGGDRGRGERGRGRGFGGDGMFGNERGFDRDRGRGMRGRGVGGRGRGFNDRGRGRPERGRGRGRDTKEIVCRHFVQRGCRNGNNCMFLHPGVN